MTKSNTIGTLQGQLAYWKGQKREPWEIVTPCEKQKITGVFSAIPYRNSLKKILRCQFAKNGAINVPCNKGIYYETIGQDGVETGYYSTKTVWD